MASSFADLVDAAATLAASAKRLQELADSEDTSRGEIRRQAGICADDASAAADIAQRL